MGTVVAAEGEGDVVYPLLTAQGVQSGEQRPPPPKLLPLPHASSWHTLLF